MFATAQTYTTARDFVLPHEQAEYAQTRNALMTQLAPAGILEQTFADEIMTATWRLRRCGLLEAALPIGDDEALEKQQRSIDRGRAQAHRMLRSSMTELRALQTERYIRRDLEITENIGLADSAKVLRACNEAPPATEEPKLEVTRPILSPNLPSSRSTSATIKT